MANVRTVQSPQNPLVKQILALREAKQRRKQNLIIIDDDRNIARAIQAGWTIQTYVRNESDHAIADDYQKEVNDYIANKASLTDFVVMPDDLFKKIAYGQSLHALALARPKNYSIDELTALASKPILKLLILDRVEKPGNLGAAVRTCDALGIDALIVVDPICDLWNPNAIRSSAGTIFGLPIYQGSYETTIATLDSLQIELFAARLEDSRDYLDIVYPKRSGIVFGNEAAGLKDRFKSYQPISIPMYGSGDSLNVSVSAAIILSEVCRQHRTC